MTTLSSFSRGQRGTIKKIRVASVSEKLMEMNLLPGNAVEVLFKAPFGDPIAVKVGAYTLSLRLDEAALIEMEE